MLNIDIYYFFMIFFLNERLLKEFILGIVVNNNLR